MGNQESEQSLWDVIKESIEYGLCTAIKFCYGFLFGSFMWTVIVQPYTRFYDFERGQYLYEFIFSIIVAFIFMSFLWIRTVIVLFLPSMIGNASQNYIITLLFITLFTHPVSNVVSNAVESIRVIGCSLTMTFEQLKERARLLLNPIVEVLRERDHSSELVNVKKGLLEVKQIVDDMVDDVRRSSMNKSDGHLISFKPSGSVKNLFRPEMKLRKMSPEYAKKVMAFVGNSSRIDFNFANLTAKFSVDDEAIRNFMKSNITTGLIDLNLTEVVHENCLAIFRQAKLKCEEAVEDLRLGCQQNIGPYFAALWCSPVSLSLSTSCPWIMNQILDEKNLCSQMLESMKSIGARPTSDIDQVYKNLSFQVVSLNEDLIKGLDQQVQMHKRIEINLELNNRTRELFLSGKRLYTFVTDKYKMRRLFYDMFLLIYELYTTITFLVIIRQAYQYQKSFRNEIKHDNNYITSTFIELDQKRRALGKTSVLPLTKDESDKYITAFTCKRRTSEERRTQRVNRNVVLIFLAFTLSLMYIDDIFYSILMSIHQHAMIRIKEIGRHRLDIRVDGEGSIAKLVKRLTKRLDSVYDLNRDTTTKECLPDPVRTRGVFYSKFFALVLLYVSIDQISIYAMRFRRVTAAFFYPEKEKQRTIYLYNSILIQRQRIKDSGLKNFIESSQDDNESKFFTVRDAITYLGNCIQNSIRM